MSAAAAVDTKDGIDREIAEKRWLLKAEMLETILLDSSLRAVESTVATYMLTHYLNADLLEMWPSAERLAAELDIPIRSIRRALAWLCGIAPKRNSRPAPKAYFIKVSGTGVRVGNTTRYKVDWARAAEGKKKLAMRREVFNARPKVSQVTAKGVTHDTLEGVTHDTRIPINNPNKNPDNRWLVSGQNACADNPPPAPEPQKAAWQRTQARAFEPKQHSLRSLADVLNQGSGVPSQEQLRQAEERLGNDILQGKGLEFFEDALGPGFEGVYQRAICAEAKRFRNGFKYMIGAAKKSEWRR